MDREQAINLAKKHFSDVARTKPEDRTAGVREAIKFWELVVEGLKKLEEDKK